MTDLEMKAEEVAIRALPCPYDPPCEDNPFSGCDICPARASVVAEILPLVQALGTAKKALEAADKEIHSEFCVGADHHPACLSVDQALAQILKENL